MKARSLVGVACAVVLVLDVAGCCAFKCCCPSSRGPQLIEQPTAFPITISAPGSYRLATNLTVPTADTTAIVITADNVTLDLDGFALSGPTTCSGSPLTCSPVGTGIGISSSNNNITIVNGTVRGMGAEGIRATGNYTRVEGVRAVSNGSHGISPGFYGCEVTDSTAAENGARGIGANTVYTFGPCKISGNLAVSNRDIGIAIGGTSTISGNTVAYNGSTGIYSGDASDLTGNTVFANGGAGLSSSNGGYAGNVLHFNNSTVSGGTQLGPNLCNGTLCP